jgi:hypothetical protein
MIQNIQKMLPQNRSSQVVWYQVCEFCTSSLALVTIPDLTLRFLLKAFLLLFWSDYDVLEESESEFESIDSVDSETACF